MNIHRLSSAGGRWVVCFALLLLAATAVPVFAAETPEGGEGGTSLTEVPAPTPKELAAAEAELHEHAEWLSSPEAKQQREASLTAYASLSAGEAKSLLVEAFPKQLEQLNADPARVLSELEVEKTLGTYSALVSEEGGETAILNSSAPVESELGGEGKAPVDLALEEAGGAYVPQNPVTEVELPSSAEKPVQLEGGVEVELPASDDHAAEPLGEMNLFIPESETATDTLLAPRAGGVEVFEQLRSPESPERFSFNLNLPAGATLPPTEAGGAEVVNSSGEQIEEVPPASAVDAQGAAVPVATSVEGDSLVLEVQHRSREIAYPALLDPEFVNDGVSLARDQPGSPLASCRGGVDSMSADFRAQVGGSGAGETGTANVDRSPAVTFSLAPAIQQSGQGRHSSVDDKRLGRAIETLRDRLHHLAQGA